MVGAMLRHMMSLRTLKRDHGWIHTLLEEAENERMHLLTFLKLRERASRFVSPSSARRVFFNAFFLSYLISPRTCHRFVGYLEEEAVRTYTHALHDIDGGGPASVWATQPAPKLAKRYWRMPEDATVRDLIVAVRADEASHSHVNTRSHPWARDRAIRFTSVIQSYQRISLNLPGVRPGALSMNPRASALSGPCLTRCTV